MQALSPVIIVSNVLACGVEFGSYTLGRRTHSSSHREPCISRRTTNGRGSLLQRTQLNAMCS